MARAAESRSAAAQVRSPLRRSLPMSSSAGPAAPAETAVPVRPTRAAASTSRPELLRYATPPLHSIGQREVEARAWEAKAETAAMLTWATNSQAVAETAAMEATAHLEVGAPAP